jgi:glycosyltransferase involved in cell wall biosynthesis
MSGGFACSALTKIWFAHRAPGSQVVHVVTTNPFFLPPLVAWAAAFRSEQTVFVLFDLYPDALVAAGWTKPGSRLARLLARVTRSGLRRCDATVFLGERLREHVETRYQPARLGRVIPVGADGSPFRNRPPGRVDEREPVTILYAGMMGRMHEIETLCTALAEPLPPGVVLRFQSMGPAYRDLCRRVHGGRAEFGGPLDDLRWSEAMQTAHVGLVTLAAGAEKVAMPSKTYSSLVSGQAVLAICPSDSDLADLIRHHDCGWVVTPGDVQALRQVWTEIASSREALHEKRTRAYQAGQTFYDMRPVAGQWRQLLVDLARAKTPERSTDRRTSR